MDNIKTPEEITRKIYSKIYEGWSEDGCSDDEIKRLFHQYVNQAISAERNANIEKIKELEETLRFNKSYTEEKIKSLESKLEAEAKAVLIHANLMLIHLIEAGVIKP